MVNRVKWFVKYSSVLFLFERCHEKKNDANVMLNCFFKILFVKEIIGVLFKNVL